MRTELMAGQYLDVLEQAHGGRRRSSAPCQVIRYKSAKYTVEQPLLLGAALAGADAELLAGATRAYGLPLGEAFQLRDDVLGVFGDPARDRQAGRRRPARGQAHRAGRAGSSGSAPPASARSCGATSATRTSTTRRRRRAARGHRQSSGALAAVESLIAERAARRARRCAGRASAEPARTVLGGPGRGRDRPGRPDARGGSRGPSDHVVVVGAGLGGLSAALRLAGAGRQVTVLERAAVPGGRAGLLELAAPDGPALPVRHRPDRADDART